MQQSIWLKTILTIRATRCFIFKGKNWGFDRWKMYKKGDKLYTYLDYDIDGWKNKVINITSANGNQLKLVFIFKHSGCYQTRLHTIQVLFEDKDILRF